MAKKDDIPKEERAKEIEPKPKEKPTKKFLGGCT